MVNWEDYEGATGNDPTSDLNEQTDQGIYPKYVVFKHPKEETTGYQGVYMSRAGIPKHMDVVEDFVFVLKPLKDKAARVAMAAYAEAIYEEKPQLARDMWEILGDFHGS